MAKTRITAVCSASKWSTANEEVRTRIIKWTREYGTHQKTAATERYCQLIYLESRSAHCDVMSPDKKCAGFTRMHWSMLPWSVWPDRRWELFFLVYQSFILILNFSENFVFVPLFACINIQYPYHILWFNNNLSLFWCVVCSIAQLLFINSS